MNEIIMDIKKKHKARIARIKDDLGKSEYIISVLACELYFEKQNTKMFKEMLDESTNITKIAD
jgi:hypothetical protein